MDNIARTRITPHNSRRDIKKKYRYNDSISKYRRSHPNNNIQKLTINPKKKFKLALENLKEGLAEFTSETNENRNSIAKEKEKQNNYNIESKSIKRFDSTHKRLSLSAPKYHILKSTTPKRNLPLLKKRSYLDTSKSLHRSFFTNKDYTTNSDIYRVDDILQPYETSSKDFNKPNYRRILGNDLKYDNDSSISYYRMNSLKIENDIKNREINNMNTILQRQNKELRQKVREMRYKINDFLNNIKLMRMDNQRLNSEKNKLLIQISNLENELDTNKNLSMNELESKSNQIAELNEEVMRLNLILDEKENEIIRLNNGINELNYTDDEENKNFNTNELIKQLNDLKNENEYLRREKEENGQIRNNLINNNNINNDNRIKNLIQENNNLKIENEKMKNYFSNIKKKNNSLENQRNEYQNNISELSQKVNILQDENNSLKNILNNYQQNSLLRNKKQNNSTNEFKNQINQLLEQNKILKQQLSQNNNNDELSFLKNDVEEKNIEINDLNEKMKNLMGQLSILKTNNSDLSKQNSKLKSDLENLNNKITKLENENINNIQQIRELNNLNNILKIKANSVNSGSLNFNKQLE